MTPHIVNLHIEAHRKTMDEQNMLMHLQGVYMRDAIASTIGNAFKGKGQQAYEYPKEPYNIFGINRELTQEEKDLEVKALFDNLQGMKQRFDKKKKEEELQASIKAR